MKNLSTLYIFLFIFLPAETLASVWINEVAWMGNDKSQYGEWVELYNDGDKAVDLRDALLYEGAGKISIIKLTKSIAPGDFYLIARSTPSTPDPVDGLADDFGLFSGSGLSNSGEHLILKSAFGEILDSVDALTGWPAGDAVTKKTMQRIINPDASIGTSWITATATPHKVNVAPSSLAISAQVKTKDEDKSSSTSVGLSSHGSPAPLGNKKENVEIFASAGRDRLALVDGPIIFESRLYTSRGDYFDGGNIYWSFGDGEIGTGTKTTHTYEFPGDYVVALNISRMGENFVAKTFVKVVPAELEIIGTSDSFLKIKNSSSYEANLGGWQIVSNKNSFVFPEDTIVLAGRELTVSAKTLGFNPKIADILKLLSPSKNLAVYFAPIKMLAENFVEVEARILEAKKQLATIMDKKTQLIHQPADMDLGTVVEVVTSEKTRVQIPVSSGLSRSASGKVEVIEKPKSVLKILLNLPVVSFRYIKSFF